METRANHLWVGVVTLALLAGLAWFFVWLAGLGEGDQNEYDIFFKQSVSGLANGSAVSYAGVPAGQVTGITLWKKDPEFVRVRIRVKDDVPIRVGTFATIQSSFTGVSTILLDGGRVDAPPLTCTEGAGATGCPEGAPVIPPKAGGFGEILANAPLLLERLATLTERLTLTLSDENQRALSGILANTNVMTEDLSQATPEIERTLQELQLTLAEARGSLAAFEQVMGSTDQLINQEGQSLATELRGTLNDAGKAAEALAVTLESAQPAARRLNEQTLPAAEATLADLQRTSRALRGVTEQLETDGASALFQGRQLPDYEPND